MSFPELGLAECLLRAVQAQGYTQPTPIQLQAIPPLLAGRDLLGSAQTGTGKTAAFALPILQRLSQGAPAPKGNRRPIRALILAPTRELAGQIAESFQVYGAFTGLRQTAVFGGVGQRPQTQALGRGVDILIATPGRLLDLIEQGFIDLRQVETVVLDEADRMLDLGFLPDVRRVFAKLPANRQTLLFSATVSAPIAQLAAALLKQPVRVHIAPVKSTTDLIQQSVVYVPREQKAGVLAQLLTSRPIVRALVFTRTKRGADRVGKQLNRVGILAGVMHGDKSQSARLRTLADFKANRTPVLVATDLAARGIDVDGISHVLNYDLPHEPETYVHRIGRTGRAGATGEAVSLCDHEERKLLAAIESLTRRNLTVEHRPGGAALVDAPPAGPNRRRSAKAAQPGREAARTAPSHGNRAPSGARPFARHKKASRASKRV